MVMTLRSGRFIVVESFVVTRSPEVPMSASSSLAAETGDLLTTLGVDRALFTMGTDCRRRGDRRHRDQPGDRAQAEAEAAISRADAT